MYLIFTPLVALKTFDFIYRLLFKYARGFL